MIRITLLNIRSGWTGSLETVLRSLQQGSIGIGVLQDMKLTRGIHMEFISD